VRVVQSNLHSCFSVIEKFRKALLEERNIPFVDVFYPEERLSSVIGRNMKFFLAVDEKGAVGCSILATSPEPLRTEILFIHALRSEKEVLGLLLSKVLSILGSKRAPDIEVRQIDRIHSPLLKTVLHEDGFGETVKDRMLLEVSQMKNNQGLTDRKIMVKNARSLLDWRALYLSSSTEQSLEESKKRVYSETPYGTIEEDDLTRLVAYDGESMVGTIGYSSCRNVAYLEKLSVQPHHADRTGIARVLVADSIRQARKRNCAYAIIDVDVDSTFKDVLRNLGARQVGQINYFFKVITSMANVT
jgi:hypothetical protein